MVADIQQRTRRPSKKPLYHKAFADYVAGQDDLPAIAVRYGLNEEYLLRLATAQKWDKRRILIAGEKRIATVESRLITQARVDSTLCTATERAASMLADSYTALIQAVTSLPIEQLDERTAEERTPDAHNGTETDPNEGSPGANTPKDAAKPRKAPFTSSPAERYRQQCSMIARKIELQKAATEGLREMIHTAQAVGLLRVERKNGQTTADDDKPIDLSKLTQLNIAIVQATGRQPAQVLAQVSASVPAAQDTVNVG